jgi:hypothetical protein
VTELPLRSVIRPFWLAGAALMAADGVTTYVALSAFPEGAREGNPLGVWVIDQIGLAGMCALKILIGVLLVYRLAVISERGHRFTWMNRSLFLRKQPVEKVQRHAVWALCFSVVLMGIVVGNNIRAIVGLAQAS